MKFTLKTFVSALALLTLANCETVTEPTVTEESGYSLQPQTFANIDNWQFQNDESLKGFVNAFKKSCENRIMKKDPHMDFGQEPEWGKFGAWQEKCANLPAQNIKPWIEQNFTPMIASTKSGDTEGLFTGYYEASLNGSMMQTERYNVPLRALPKDLISVDLGSFRQDLRGKRIAGRVVGNKLKPYEDRAEIVAEKMPLSVDKTLMWVDSPVDAFFLEIQGSGVVKMADGSIQRVGYAGQNGHEYTAIGRVLIEMGELTKDNVSMQTIRTWLEQNPDQAQTIMNENRSYVFFTKQDKEGPVGAEGVTLTPQHSLAVDRGLYPYGLPVWLDVEDPQNEDARLQRMMVAQDTGGAIKGAVRGDFFWGYGDYAETQAGVMVSRGSMTVMVPK